MHLSPNQDREVQAAFDGYVRLEWLPIETAPKDGTLIWVFYNHDAAPYYIEETGKLSDYAANADGGVFLDGTGQVPAKWSDGYYDGNEMEGEPQYYVPGAWFAWFNGDSEYVCNPTHWMPLPAAPN